MNVLRGAGAGAGFLDGDSGIAVRFF